MNKRVSQKNCIDSSKEREKKMSFHFRIINDSELFCLCDFFFHVFIITLSSLFLDSLFSQIHAIYFVSNIAFDVIVIFESNHVFSSKSLPIVIVIVAISLSNVFVTTYKITRIFADWKLRCLHRQKVFINGITTNASSSSLFLSSLT